MHFLRPISRLLSKVTTPSLRGRAGGGSSLLLLLFLVSCTTDTDLRPSSTESETETKGRIVLTLGGDDLFLDLETRATHDLTDIAGYVFTLTGTPDEGEAVAGREVTLTRIGQTNTFMGVVEAGTYYLTADNYADAASSKPYYSGKSEDFTVAAATTEEVSIALGTPKNAAVTYLLDDSFTTLYNNPTIDIKDGNTTLATLTAPAANATSLTNAVYCHVATTPATQTAYTLSGTPISRSLTYSVTARAISGATSGTYVTDVVGATGTITVASGRHTVITLTANSVTGEVIPIIGGEDYEGAFD